MTKRGRPKLPEPVAFFIWIAVELERDTRSEHAERRSLREGANRAAKAFQPYGNFSAERLRKMHADFDSRMQAYYGDQNMARAHAALLRPFRITRATAEWRIDVMETIYRTEPLYPPAELMTHEMNL